MEIVEITVIYDDACEVCRRCRVWLERSAQLVPISFVAAGDRAAVAALGLDPSLVPVGDELVVVGHGGPDDVRPIWVGPDAFITCLWALAEHRRLAGRLQAAAMRPVAKAAFHALSSGRGQINRVLRGDPSASAVCTSDACQPAR